MISRHRNCAFSDYQLMCQGVAQQLNYLLPESSFSDIVQMQVLEDLQSDPKNSQHHLQHPQIRANIDKLVTAGLVQMR